MRRITAIACAAAVLTIATPSHASASPGCSLDTVRTEITTQVANEQTRDCLEQLIAANKDDDSGPDFLICPILQMLSPGAPPWILIDSEGDVALLDYVVIGPDGTVYYFYVWVWDCPPYDI